MEFYRDKLRKARKRKKVTMDELAHKMGIDRCTIGTWEKGEKMIPCLEQMPEMHGCFMGSERTARIY